jgi:2-iminobutanoate/2-iminopropanoate deaminase
VRDPFFVRSDREWDQTWPMSQMVKAGDLLLLSGQIAYDERGELVGAGDVVAQARQVFRNLQHVLGRVGCDLTSIVRLTNYFATGEMNMETTLRYWEVRRDFFGDHRPASTGLLVAGLMTPGILLEVDAIAYAPGIEIPQELSSH